MNTQIFKDIITIIKNEQAQRLSRLDNQHPDYAYNQWLFTDLPFINELCLMLLVTLRHELERILIAFASRVNENKTKMSAEEYNKKVEGYNKMGQKKKWKEINKKLNIESYDKYKFIEVLRFLSNSYKHDSFGSPSKDLLSYLNLDTEIDYCPLSEGGIFQKELSKFIGLSENADYYNITECFVGIASDCLSYIKNNNKLCTVSVSLTKFSI